VKLIWRALYNTIGIRLFLLAYRFYSLFNDKAKEGWKGQKGLFNKIAQTINSPGERRRLPVIWFHCASAGEFEQARPLVAALRDKARTVITLFSPAGYKSARNYTQADLVCYMPADTRKNARRMLQLLNPSVIIFIRFDVWPNYVWTAAKMGIPVMLVNATLHEKSQRKWLIVRSFLRSVYKNINIICAISDVDARRLKLLYPREADIKITGDTRFDQVIARKGLAGKKLEGLLPEFHIPVIIAGSTYIEDERVVLDAYQKVLERWGDAQLILVPHEPEPHRLSEIDDLTSQMGIPYILLSQIERSAVYGKVIVVDRIGVLAELYMLGDITFIGGSFHGSVHNVMEPAVMGKPVLFGPTIHNSLEAIMLRERGAGVMVKDGDEMAAELIKLLSDHKLRHDLGKAALNLIEENAGATEKIVSCIEEYLK
jgi:3-deoxy-D-manno-octulosonic-acid transferase